jgi:hypothetical protein
LIAIDLKFIERDLGEHGHLVVEPSTGDSVEVVTQLAYENMAWYRFAGPFDNARQVPRNGDIVAVCSRRVVKLLSEFIAVKNER